MAFIDTELKVDDIKIGDTRCFEAGETQVGIFRQPEGVYALDNMCPHRGAPLHDGTVTESFVTCPWHQWQFELKDGVCKNIPGMRAKTYPVEVRDGVIWVDIEGAK